MSEPLTVTDLTRRVDLSLRERFSEVDVVGEVSGFKAHTSGHWYFSLKDQDATLSCVMFRGHNQKLSRQPREGERVIATGDLSVYAQRGTYSLGVRALKKAGQGDAAQRLRELTERLRREGLFDPAKQRPLPTFPRCLGVATSASGAAIRDVLHVARQRWPGLPIRVAPCLVQGPGAAADIVRALRLLAADGQCDVVIVGRGGGSAEDLAAFNEEILVRAVAEYPLPIVSAVGHETDNSLCDLAADRRAATPSNAAELVVPVRRVVVEAVEALRSRLGRSSQRAVERARHRVTLARLVHPRTRIENGRLRLDDLDERLRAAIERRVERCRARLARVPVRAPERLLQDRRARLILDDGKAKAAIARLVARREHAVVSAAGRLDALSPLAVLVRGYAIVRKEGVVVRDTAVLASGDTVELRLGAGEATAEIRAVR